MKADLGDASRFCRIIALRADSLQQCRPDQGGFATQLRQLATTRRHANAGTALRLVRPTALRLARVGYR
jgi:hypothetical protein